MVLALAMVVLTPAAAGQNLSPEFREKLEARADWLRSWLECPTKLDWPALPPSGRSTFRSDAPARTDVTVPQYAFYYHGIPGEEARCLPVVIVQAHRVQSSDG